MLGDQKRVDPTLVLETRSRKRSLIAEQDPNKRRHLESDGQVEESQRIKASSQPGTGDPVVRNEDVRTVALGILSTVVDKAVKSDDAPVPLCYRERVE